MMKYKILCACAVFAFAVAITPAQTKNSMSGTCAKPDVQQSVPAGDHEGHMFTLGQGKCAAKGEIGGVASKEGMFSEHGDTTGNRGKAWGVYVETFESGDKVFYTYQTTGTMKDGALVTGGNKYQITGGTGKMKGIKGTGGCKLTGSADGGLTYACNGQYTFATAAPAK
jgi:hypothetical protein